MHFRSAFVAMLLAGATGYYSVEVYANQQATNFAEEWRNSLTDGSKMEYGSVEGDPYGSGAIINDFTYQADEGVLKARAIELGGFEKSENDRLIKFGKVLISDLQMKMKEPGDFFTIASIEAENIESQELEALLEGEFTVKNLQSLHSGPLSMETIGFYQNGVQFLKTESIRINEIVKGRIDQFSIHNLELQADEDFDRISVGEFQAKGLGLDNSVKSFWEGFDTVREERLPDFHKIYQIASAERPTGYFFRDIELLFEDGNITIDRFAAGAEGDDPDVYEYSGKLESLVFNGDVVASIREQSSENPAAQKIFEALSGDDSLEINGGFSGTYNLKNQFMDGGFDIDLKDLIKTSLNMSGTALAYFDPQQTKGQFAAPDGTPATLSSFSISVEDYKLVRLILDVIGQSMGVDRAGLAAQFGYLSRLPLAGHVTPRIDQAIRSVQAFIEEPSKITLSLAPQEPVIIKEFYENLGPEPDIGALAERFEFMITSE